MPRVTVIVTVFKRNKHLPEALESLEKQVYRDFEVLVTDDANLEETRRICESFERRLDIRYRSNPEALGTLGNLCSALPESRGEYVSVLNDDDTFHPQMLEMLVPPLEKDPEVVLTFSNYHIVDGSGNLLNEATQASLRQRGREGLSPGKIGESFEFALRRNVMAVIGCVFRKQVFASSWNTKEVAGAYDYWLAMQLGRVGKFFFIKAPLMSWRQHIDSVSSRPSESVFSGEVYIYKNLLGWELTATQTAYAAAQQAHFLQLRGKELLAHEHDRSLARASLIESLAVSYCNKTLLVLTLTYLPRILLRPLLWAWHSSLNFRLSRGWKTFSPG